MKKLPAALVAACLAAGALFAIPAFGATKTVSVKDYAFAPKSLSVKKGTKVTWRWRGSAAHDVTVKSGPVKFHSPLKTRGTYTRTLTRRGTYKIICTIHPGMQMTLKVG